MSEPMSEPMSETISETISESIVSGDSENAPVLAWRFAAPDGTSAYQRTPQQIGETYTVGASNPSTNPSHKPGTLDDRKSVWVGVWGFHAALQPTTALLYASQTFVERVRLSGDRHRQGGLVAATERTPLFRADAAPTLLRFAVDCAARAVQAQPGFVGDNAANPAFGSQQWLAEGALADARAYLDGSASDALIETFGNAHVRPGHHGAAYGERVALQAAYFALRACHLHHDNDGWVMYELDMSLRRAVDAVASVSKGRDAWNAERQWQDETLHARLMALCPQTVDAAPAGYTEEEAS